MHKSEGFGREILNLQRFNYLYSIRVKGCVYSQYLTGWPCQSPRELYYNFMLNILMIRTQVKFQHYFLVFCESCDLMNMISIRSLPFSSHSPASATITFHFHIQPQKIVITQPTTDRSLSDALHVTHVTFVEIGPYKNIPTPMPLVFDLPLSLFQMEKPYTQFILV